MTTEMITLKLDEKFLKEIDKTVRGAHYQNRTEFIREALREKMHEVRYRQAYEKIKHILGASKRSPITEEEYERVREEVAEEIHRKLQKRSSGRK